MKTTRRRFLGAAAAGAISMGGVPLIRAQAGGRFRTALIGSGWWGMNVLNEAMASKRCQVVALCDVSSDALEVAAEQVNEATGDTPKTYRDYRELLEKEKVEVAIVATPDHWHALNTIAALNAGAHVFVEKPTGHTIGESRAMVNAARATGGVVQVGLHRRIGPHHVSAQKFLKDGGVGKSEVCRHQGRAAWDRVLFLRGEGNVARGVARWLDVLPVAKGRGCDP